MITRVLLVGMSGAGKSTMGSTAAAWLGWTFVDMDDAIEKREGRSIPEIFEQDGESAFRAMEADLLARLMQESDVIISTGGGAVCNQQAQDVIHASEGTLSIWLHADAETLVRRVNQHNDANRTTARPMLAGDDPLQRMKTLLHDREQYYGAADVTIPVGNRSSEATASDIQELVRLANGGISDVELDTGKVKSSIQVGQGVADTLPDLIESRWPNAQAIWIGVDTNVANAHREWLAGISESIDATIHIFEIASGESSKSLDTYRDILDWMLIGGVQRGDVVIALGGGVVGDLMGFAAATVLRGINLVQMPTTLLAMVDSSVGGKTGINHPAGKNLIGSFYQPPVVLVDSNFLKSLPERELRSGFAEMIKHGVIQASTPRGEAGFLTEVMDRNAEWILKLWEPLMSWVIRQNISLKANVVAEDEREANLRQILNFGHTIGHGIEASGYRLLHGEAVAVGMVAAVNLAVVRGDIDKEYADALITRLQAYHLPTSAQFVPDDVLTHMGADKKKVAGKQNWVLPAAAGGVQVTNDVSPEQVLAAIKSVLAD